MLSRFWDKTEKYIYPNGEEYRFLPDGVVHSINAEGVRLTEHPDGAKSVAFPNGQLVEFKATGEMVTHEDGATAFVE